LSGLKVYKVSVLKNFIEKLKFKYFLVDLVKLYCNSNCKVINYPIKCNIIRNRKARIGNIAKANNKILNIQKII
jgi:hypothetical protein